MKWDGSYLGAFPPKDCRLFPHPTFHKYLYINEEIQGYALACKIPSFCLIDELKSFFSITKIGSHWLHRGAQVLVLIRPFEGYKLSTFSALVKEEPLLRESVERLIKYHSLLGQRLTEKHLIFVCQGKEAFVTSIGHFQNSGSDGGMSKTSTRLRTTWFEDDDHFLNSTFPLNHEYYSRLNEEAEAILSRVSPNLSLYMSSLLRNIYNSI